MASPQLEDGYLRIANEVWNQLMMSKFNREQRGIIDLIIRLSWGCGKKWAYIPRQKDFCLAGVYESHVKRELQWLEKANVIRVDWEQKLFQFNKYYTEWRVSIVAGYDNERLTELVAQNLQISKIDGGSTYKEVRSSAQNLQISKIELTNKEDLRPSNLHGDNVRVLPKDNIKDINNKDIQTDREDTDPPSQSVGSLPDSEFETLTPLQEVCQAYEKHIGILGPLQVDRLRFWLEEPELAKPVDVVIKAIETACEAGRRRIGYIEGILRNWHNDGVKTLADIERVDGRARGDPSERRTRYDPIAFQKMLEEAGIDATRSG